MSTADQTPARADAGTLVVIASAALALGVAVWLLPASVHIVGWTRDVHRVAVFAPAYWLTRIGVLAAGASAGAWLAVRRRPERAVALRRVVAPLNLLWIWALPYLPWLGDWFPLLGVLAGPVRWLFAGLAAIGVVTGLVRLLPVAWPPVVPGVRTALAVSLVIYATLGLRSLGTIGLGGDEPHYLVITHSLLVDRDLQIENNHTRGDYLSFFRGTLRPDYMQRGTNGQIYSIHAPGLSALLLPGYAAGGARGAVATAALLAALAAAAVFALVSRLAGAPVGWLVWGMVSLTVPFVPHAWALYPEIAGAAVVAWALVWWTAPVGERTGVWVWRGVCLATLPWLHTKFSVLLAGLVLMLMWTLRARRRPALALLVPIAVSGAAWLAFFYVVYGRIDPEAPYGGYVAQFVRFSNVPRSLLGQLFDQKFGLLVYAPVLGFAAVGLFARRVEAAVVVPAALALVYIVSSARLYMWWGGSSAPARFLVPVLPLLAPALAVSITRARGRWWAGVLAACAFLSLVTAAVGVAGTRELLLFSPPHGFARILDRLQGSAPLTAAVPTFTQEDWIRPGMRLLPWLGAALAALAATRICARWRPEAIWPAAGAVAAFAVAGAALHVSFPSDVRAESSERGTLALLQAYHPVRARAFDYGRLSRLSPADWLSRAVFRRDRRPGRDVDALHRLTNALTLPPGRYEVRVWFEGSRSPGGAIEAIVPGGQTLIRSDEPLANPALLRLDLPVPVPLLWVRATDEESARRVSRVELTPIEVYLEAVDRRIEAVAVEPLASRPGAYLAYLDGYVFPEQGVFWTRGTGRGSVLVVPAGAETVELVLYVPSETTVSVWVGETREQMLVRGGEARSIHLPVPAGTRAVPLAFQADASFVPARLDPSSADTRELGCQVRVTLQ
jgi:hypothetical protein